MNDIHNKLVSYFSNKEKPIILDVGSYLMEDANAFAHVFPNGKVYAFECDPRNIEQIKLRRGNAPNTELIEVAISNTNGETEFWQSQKINFNSPYFLSGSMRKPTGHLSEYPVSFSSSPIKIPCITLDSWYNFNLKEFPIELVWCDVNGGEREFLEGAVETLKNTHLLWIECFNKEMYDGEVNCEWVSKFVENLGFKYVWEFGHNNLYQRKI